MSNFTLLATNYTNIVNQTAFDTIESFQQLSANEFSKISKASAETSSYFDSMMGNISAISNSSVLTMNGLVSAITTEVMQFNNTFDALKVELTNQFMQDNTSLTQHYNQLLSNLDADMSTIKANFSQINARIDDNFSNITNIILNNMNYSVYHNFAELVSVPGSSLIYMQRSSGAKKCVISARVTIAGNSTSHCDVYMGPNTGEPNDLYYVASCYPSGVSCNYLSSSAVYIYGPNEVVYIVVNNKWGTCQRIQQIIVDEICF